jgi:hypothetical protein
LAARLPLPLIGSSISRWPAAAFFGFLPLALAVLRAFLPLALVGGAACLLGGEAALQRIHQVDDVAARSSARPWPPAGRALLVDQIDQRGFVLVLELVRLERARLLLDDVLGEIEHVLGDLDVLDVVEIFFSLRTS